MKVREIKKEDIKVGVKVIHKVDYNKGDFNTKTIRRTYMDRVFYESNEWDFIDSVKESYLLVEEEPKSNDTKVMTYVGGNPYLTSGKNYNVKDAGLGVYELKGDSGNKRIELKEFFVDPTSVRENETAGAKHDQDKLKPSLLFNDFPHAIEEVLKVLKFGSEKYSEGNWLKVENGVERYRNAAHRHMLSQEEFDDESGLLHLAHEATSVLMMLELKLREIEYAKQVE